MSETTCPNESPEALKRAGEIATAEVQREIDRIVEAEESGAVH